MIVPVILSGGSGTRLWPLSTPQRPKQFLPLTGPLSLFRQTVDRVADPATYAPPIVVANAAHEGLCRAELDGLDGWRLILEPIARNTAAAIVMAADVAQRQHGPDALILVMPSDHLIGDLQAFHQAVKAGVEPARSDRLVTFGVAPTHPETGFGYLEAGEPLDGTAGAFTVARFTEKPDVRTAIQMLETGKFFWNGGIFLFSAGALLSAAQQLAPDVYSAASAAIHQGKDDGQSIRPSADALAPSPDISVDYAIMERSNQVAMIVLDARWSDVGSWDALAEVAGSVAASDEFVTQVQSSNCYIRSDGIKLALLGVDDLIVVAAGDQVVIMKRGQSQQIRQLALAATGG
jgi:mannose-1-phosphate guanylyltransferase/mannose-1-phosphate guanylyltransferase/mannose-6-phosphate isomerase